jgi:hypothetical protein
MTGESPDITELLADALHEAKAEEVRTRQAAERAQQATSIWTHLNEYQAKKWHAHIVSVGETGFFQSLRSSREARIQNLEAWLKASEEEARAAFKKFPFDLDRECKAAGIELDRTSRHPRYTIKNFIVIEVNEARLNVSVTPRDGNAVNIPSDVPAIVDLLQRESRRLFERAFDDQRLLKSLFTAYQAVVREDSRDIGEDVSIRRVIHRMGKNLANFSLDEFNVDLARAIKENKTTFEDHSLRLGHTRNTRQGMLLHELEGSGYVGFIAFRKS